MLTGLWVVAILAVLWGFRRKPRQYTRMTTLILPSSIVIRQDD